jgi:hypothetical protein
LLPGAAPARAAAQRRLNVLFATTPIYLLIRLGYLAVRTGWLARTGMRVLWDQPHAGNHDVPEAMQRIAASRKDR